MARRKYFGLLFVLSLLSVFMQACASGSAPAPEAPIVEEPDQLEQVVQPAHQLLSSESLAPGQHSYSYIASTGEEVVLLMYLPENYEAQENWPLIVFLHGWGSYGKNTDLIINQGGLPAFLNNGEEFGFIVVSPQLPDGRWGKYYVYIEELIMHISESVSVDMNRLSLTGLSLGATGVWQYALEYPDRFAAIVPVAGVAKSSSTDFVPDGICTLKDLGVWVFHGEEDAPPTLESVQAVVSALESCGADIKLTMYPGAGHEDTWPLTYADPALFEWLEGQSK